MPQIKLILELLIDEEEVKRVPLSMRIGDVILALGSELEDECDEIETKEVDTDKSIKVTKSGMTAIDIIRAVGSTFQAYIDFVDDPQLREHLSFGAQFINAMIEISKIHPDDEEAYSRELLEWLKKRNKKETTLEY